MFYSSFKQLHEPTPYLATINNPVIRKALTRIRQGVSALRSYQFRHSKVPVNLECPFCKGTHESEMHFISFSLSLSFQSFMSLFVFYGIGLLYFSMCAARKLKLDPPSVTRLEENYHDNVREFIYQLLLTWKRRHPEVRVRDLIKVLSESKLRKPALELRKFFSSIHCAE